MGIKRTSNNSLSNAPKMSTGFSSAAIPNAPTIGTATATSDVAATVTYTAAVLGATGSTFTATSNPGSVTGTGSSPITVTGLTASTSYTFTVTAGNANGTSAASSASNSITTSAPVAIDGYIALATATVTSGGTPNIIFSDIPSGYTHLELRYTARATAAQVRAELYIEFNGDTTAANYKTQVYRTSGSSIVREEVSNILYCGSVLSANANSNFFGSGTITIPDFASSVKKKTTISYSGTNNGPSNNGGAQIFGGTWSGTNAINEIKITPTAGSLAQHSKFYLYGIK